jgi:DNA-binding transcriptional regulator YiaG
MQRRHWPTLLNGARDATVAALIGVTPLAVANWRAGRSRPQPRNEAKLRLVRALARQIGA